ncbi:MAG: PBP1A family penicillin-binding protein [Desulfobacteraceae bacterium]|nr:MAG: PBP1A family penicillin-binding protein [Desulfobacteraceae bacterium]
MKFLGKLFKLLLVLMVFGLFFGVLGFICVYYHFASDLPKIASLSDYRPPVITTIYADDDRKIGEFYEQQRMVIPLSEMPAQLTQAFISAEDARYYKHPGVDLHSIIRAFYMNLKAGDIVQGGSTITQQVTKSFLLTPERSYQRKIKEAILAFRIDKQFTKDQILFLYLNQIYLGNGAYGVEAASQNYFGKSARDLNLAECAMLAGLPQAPSRYSPFSYPEKAKARQRYTLTRMAEEGYITKEEAEKAAHTAMDIRPRRNWYRDTVPEYTENIRQTLLEMFGRQKVYNEGLQVYTSVNIDMQQMGRSAVQKGLYDLDKRQGYRGPLEHLLPEQIEGFSHTLAGQLINAPLSEGMIIKGIVTKVSDPAGSVTVRIGTEQGVIRLKDMKWARKPNPEVDYYAATIGAPSQAVDVGDVVLVRVVSKQEGRKEWNLALEQTPEVEAALVCIETQTGKVKTMVGGRDFSSSQFNRAIQSLRQPGSAFKPIIYAAALDKGFTASSVIVDAPIAFENSDNDSVWKPKNYDMKFKGFTLFREGLIDSRNVITVKILQDIGTRYAVDYARKMGITAKLDRNLALALGSSGVSLLELVKAYSVFANQGRLIDPCFIQKVVDRDGNVLVEYSPNPRQVIEESTAYVMTYLMEEVVKYGTGWRVKALKRPAAGKTGTTNNLNDAWFVGYTPEYVTGVWVGFDHEKSLGSKETGSQAASPIWLDFMQQALEGRPVSVFQVPDSVVFVKIDAQTGLLPVPESHEIVLECFKEENAPTQYSKRPGTVTETEDFFKGGF